MIFFPHSIYNVDHRHGFSAELRISAHRASPAYAAFEDLQEPFVNVTPEIPDEGAILLSSGHKMVPDLAHDRTVIRQLAMHGMTIQVSLPFDTPNDATARSEIRLAGAAIRPARTLHHVVDEALPNFQDDRGELLPLTERKRILIQQLQGEDLGTVSPRQVAQQLVEEELASSGAGPGSIHNQTVFKSTTGTPILVRKSAANAGAPPPPIDFGAETLHQATLAQPISIAALDQPFATAATSALLTTRNLDPSALRPLWLTGQLEMTGGLAFVGPETQMTIKRVFNGQVFEQGRIYISEGRFEIHIQEPTGFLVAELGTSDGRLLGRGEMNLLDVIQSLNKSEDHINQLRLALRPTTEGASVNTISAYSHGQQRILVADSRVEIQAYTDPQRVNDEGRFTDASISHDSTFVARAMAKDHWSSLIIGQADAPQDIRLFPKSMVEALIQLNSSTAAENKEAHQLSVVLGLVKSNGELLSGAQVEMAGDAQPIYFNDLYLPDKTATGTGRNGLFAFLRIPSGVQAVRVRWGGRVYPAQIFPSENKNITYLELEVHEKITSQFHVYDSQNPNQELASRIRFVGTEDVLNIQPRELVEYSVAANPNMVEVEAGPQYEISRTTVSGQPHMVHVPMISRPWLSALAANAQVALHPKLGHIVGYVDGQDFEVELTGYAPGLPMQIVYFDSKGQPVTGKTGVAGGGFAIFNAPPGVQTLYVHPTQSRETFSQIVVTEPGYVQVVTH